MVAYGLPGLLAAFDAFLFEPVSCWFDLVLLALFELEVLEVLELFNLDLDLDLVELEVPESRDLSLDESLDESLDRSLVLSFLSFLLDI